MRSSRRGLRRASFAILVSSLSLPEPSPPPSRSRTPATRARARSVRRSPTPTSAAGADTITFNVSGAGCDGSGICTIVPATGLPTLTGTVLVDGYTQPGASPNTNALGGTNAVLKIVLSGAASFESPGLTLNGNASTIRGLVINGFLTGSARVSRPTARSSGVHRRRRRGSDGCIQLVGRRRVRRRTNLTIGGPLPADRNAHLRQQRRHPFGPFSRKLDPGQSHRHDGLGRRAARQHLTAGGGPRHRLDRDPRQRRLGQRTGHQRLSPSPSSSLAAGCDRSYLIQGNWIGTDVTGTIPLGNDGWGIAMSDKNVTVGGTAAARATSSPTTGAGSSTPQATATRRSAAITSSPTRGPSPASPGSASTSGSMASP